MTLIQAFILGIVQGLTEFLPISSSAHLVLIPYLFNWNIPAGQVFPFDVLVQLGTLAAVILYFWNDLIKILRSFFKGLANKEPFKEAEARLGWYLILATIPAGIFGMLVKKQVEVAFSSPTVTALFLFGTAGLLLLADLVGKRTRTLEDITWWDALWIGLFQAISIFPGISRSGATITGGMTRNLDRSSSARFSFLMSIPVMLGASLVSIKDLLAAPDLASFIPALLLGFSAATIVGYLSIHWLLSFIKRKKFYVFSIYCVLFACLILVVGALRTSGAQANAPLTPASTLASPLAATTTVQGTSNDQITDVSYSLSTAWVIPTLSGCAGVLGNSGLVTHELSTPALDIGKTDLIIRWGAPLQLAEVANQITSERLTVVVNSQNPLTSLTSEMSRKLFSGQFSTWGDLYKACPKCFAANYDDSMDGSAIALNFYPRGEDIQDIFDRVVMNGQPVARGNALLIPDPQAMVEALQSDKTGIGFIPAHVLATGLKEINLSDLDPSTLQQPVLVISKTQPQGAEKELLLCIQKVLNP